MRLAVLALMLAGCAAPVSAPPPPSECHGRMFAISVDLTRCNWIEIDAGSFVCAWDGGS